MSFASRLGKSFADEFMNYQTRMMALNLICLCVAAALQLKYGWTSFTRPVWASVVLFIGPGLVLGTWMHAPRVPMRIFWLRYLAVVAVYIVLLSLFFEMRHIFPQINQGFETAMMLILAAAGVGTMIFITRHLGSIQSANVQEGASN